jgi:hypothetical protein
VQRWLTGKTNYLKKTSRSEIKRPTVIYPPPVLNQFIFQYLSLSCTLTIYDGIPTTRTGSSVLLLSILWHETKKKSTRNHSKFHKRQTGKPPLVQHASHIHVGIQPNPFLSFHCAPRFVVGLCLDSHSCSKIIIIIIIIIISEGNISKYGTAFEHKTYHQ